MSAARRAATYIAIRSEAALAPAADDPPALDEYCALGALTDRAGVSDAALAAASADPDDAMAAVARALVAARAMLRPARPEAPVSNAAATRVDRPVGLDGDVRVRLLGAAFAECGQRGWRAMEVPRALLRSIGSSDGTIALLRAAFSNDDGALVNAMGQGFDRAELRLAARLAAGRPLRKGLATAVSAFGGADGRERALAWSSRLRAIRQAGRKKRGALTAALDAAGDAGAVLHDAAIAADRVWDALEKPPPVTVRVRLFCDAVETRDVDGLTLAPAQGGSADGRSPTLRCAGSCGDGLREAFCALLDGVDAPREQAIIVEQPLEAAVARWLASESVAVEPALPWPAAEPAQPVIAPAMTFSASRLNLHAKCPRRWFYEYLCAAVDERSTANAVYGKVFHAALEALHREVRQPAQWSQAEVADKLVSFLDAAFGQAHREFASQLEYEVLRLRARRVAQHYVRWLFEEAADAPLEIVEIETRQQLELGGHRFVGYIDRIDRPAAGGPITIFDYKTGRIEDDPESYVRQVREGEEAQLALYYAMRRAQGDQVARIALVSIRDTRERTWVLALDIADESGGHVLPRRERQGVVRASCSIADLEASLSALTRRCDTLTRDGVAHFAVGEDPPCSYCAYAVSCRERPAEGERIFAR